MPHQIDPKFGNIIAHGQGFSFSSSAPTLIPMPDLRTIITSPLINVPVPGDVDTGGIVGAIIDIVGGIVGGRGPVSFNFPQAPGGTPPLLPGRIPPAPLAPGSPGSCAPNPCCSGQHLNKSRGCDGSPPGSKCVSNRRMNSLNPKALRRATRRLKGFERAVKGTRKQLRTLSRI